MIIVSASFPAETNGVCHTGRCDRWRVKCFANPTHNSATSKNAEPLCSQKRLVACERWGEAAGWGSFVLNWGFFLKSFVFPPPSFMSFVKTGQNHKSCLKRHLWDYCTFLVLYFRGGSLVQLRAECSTAAANQRPVSWLWISIQSTGQWGWTTLSLDLDIFHSVATGDAKTEILRFRYSVFGTPKPEWCAP